MNLPDKAKRSHLLRLLFAAALVSLLAAAIASLSCTSVRNTFKGAFADEQHAYKTAVELYTVTLQNLVELREAGRISDEDMVTIERFRRSARSALDGWELALENGDSPEKAVGKFYEAMAQLTAEVDLHQASTE